MKSLSIVLPAHNEAAVIEKTVLAAKSVVQTITDKWEIIVVNDGSMDRTGGICEHLTTQDSNFKVVHHEKNRGYGAALKSGILKSRYELIFFSDSDGQFDFNEMPTLMEHIQDYDIVVGYRIKRQDSFFRLLNAWAWNMLVRLVLHIRIRDIDCAFKVFHREVFDRIQIRSNGAMVNTEIFAQAARFKMKVKQVGVRHFPRHHGEATGANVRVILKAFYELFHLWQKLRHVSNDQAGLFKGGGNMVADH